MSYFKKHELKTTYEEQQIEWKVVNFFSKMDSLRHVQVESRSRKFFYGGSKWAIHLCRDRGSNLWHLFAACDEYGDNMEVESVLALKKVDGSLDESLMQNDGEKYDGYYYIYTCTDEELWEREEELTTSDSLTIVCIMKSGSSYYPVPTFFESPSVKLIDFEHLFACKDSCDVTLQVKDKAFKAHKAVLMARSPVFSAMFEHDMKEKETGIINIQDCDPESFHEFLEYIYRGKLGSISFPSVLHLYTTSDKYLVQGLKSLCIQYMQQCLTEDNVCDVIVLAEKNDEAKLLSSAQRFFFKNAAQIVNTPKWKSLLENNSDLVNELIIEMTSRINI